MYLNLLTLRWWSQLHVKSVRFEKKEKKRIFLLYHNGRGNTENKSVLSTYYIAGASFDRFGSFWNYLANLRGYVKAIFVKRRMFNTDGQMDRRIGGHA